MLTDPKGRGHALLWGHPGAPRGQQGAEGAEENVGKSLYRSFHRKDGQV